MLARQTEPQAGPGGAWERGSVSVPPRAVCDVRPPPQLLPSLPLSPPPGSLRPRGSACSASLSLCVGFSWVVRAWGELSWTLARPAQKVGGWSACSPSWGRPGPWRHRTPSPWAPASGRRAAGGLCGGGGNWVALSPPPLPPQCSPTRALLPAEAPPSPTPTTLRCSHMSEGSSTCLFVPPPLCLSWSLSSRVSLSL